MGRVGTVMQSTCVTLRVRGRDRTKAGAMLADIKSCMCTGVVEWWSSVSSNGNSSELQEPPAARRKGCKKHTVAL